MLRNIAMYTVRHLPVRKPLVQEVLNFVDRFTALYFMATGAPPAVRQIKILPMKSICLLANNIQNDVVTIYRSQEVLKMLSLYTQIFLALVEENLISPSKLFCRNICNFPTNIFCCKLCPSNKPEEKFTMI
jgi:hypothetical protein